MKYYFQFFLLMLSSSFIFSQQNDSIPKHKTPPKTLQHGMGALLLEPGKYEQIPHLKIESFSEKVKHTVLAANSSFQVPSPPVGDQGMMGSCVGWSVGYTFLSSYLQRHEPKPINWNGGNETSANFVYHFSKVNSDCPRAGSYLHVGFECIRDNGSCLYNSWKSSWPDNPKIDDCNTLPNAQQLAEACRYSSPWKFGKVPVSCQPSATDGPVLWEAVTSTDVNTVKAALVQYNWPVVISFNVTNSFIDMWYNGGIWTSNDASNLGGHSVGIIGFDDNKSFNGQKGMFKCQNQWGNIEGENGYFWVSYNLVSAGCLREIYVWVRDEPAFAGCAANCPD